MARSLRMIAPFDVLTGNISGTRKLKYNDKMNPAWDAPDGQQYARNYKPRYIGIYRAKTGKTTFSVKEKTSTTLNAASRRRMAAMGGTCGMYGTPGGWRFPLTVMTRAQQVFQFLRERDPELTYRKCFFAALYNGLINKQEVITIEGAAGVYDDFQVGNPWAEGPAVTPMGLINDEIFFKFFEQLAPYGSSYTLDGKKAYYYSGWSWYEVANSVKLNTIPITTTVIGENTYVIIDDHADDPRFVGYMDDGTFVYVKDADLIGSDDVKNYITTTQAPTP